MSALGLKQHTVSRVAAQKEGTAVTFTLTTPGTEDPEAGTFSSASSSSITGYATRVRGDSERYKALGLTESEAATLDFTADTYGDTPALNSSVSWSSSTWFVRDVEPWAPDGNTVSSRVVVSRG